MKSLSTLLTLLITSASLLAADVDGSKDHPLITRYPGSEIVYYEQQNFVEYVLPLGPIGWDSEGKVIFEPQQEIEGAITRIGYRYTGERTAMEVFRNYVEALEQAGFEILVTGKGDDGSNAPAGANWARKAYPNLPPAAGDGVGNFGFVDRRRAVVAKYSGPTGEVYVSMQVCQRGETQVNWQLDIIEPEPLESGLVEVDIDYLRSEIERTGHVALYGIYFDVDLATIKPESESALSTIAELLKGNDWKLYVVGHTDMTGSLEHNMELSQARAQSVVIALTTQHGVAGDRLKGYGVGPLCPVAANSSDDGLALNRRVELVKR